MPKLKKIFLILICAALPALTNSAEFFPNHNSGNIQSNDELTLIANYLLRLGQYMGYNLQQDAPESESPSDTLLTYLSDSTSQTLGQKIFEQTAWVTILGAIPVNTSSQEVQNFVPSSNPSNAINKQANFTFANYTKEDSTGISVIPNIDHKEYINDPGSQSALNILSTEDSTFCDPPSSTTSSTSSTTSSNPCLSTRVIMDNVLADIMTDNKLPDAGSIYSEQNLASLAGQLNSNTLTAPLLYDVDGSSTSSSEKSTGLPSKTQAQQAGNFVRYIINELSAQSFFNKTAYSTEWLSAYPNGSATLVGDTNAQSTQLQAQTNLENYFTSLRAFTAQSSVAINNIYGILSKRMAQSTPADSSQKSSTSSQALSEYQLASWRIYDPTHQQQWIDQLNTASAATVQKEIAILLSEMNYQLYLNRQQEERILLTNSIQLLQALNLNKPVLASSSGQVSTTVN